MTTEPTRRGVIVTMAPYGVAFLITIAVIIFCQSELADSTLHAEPDPGSAVTSLQGDMS